MTETSLCPCCRGAGAFVIPCRCHGHPNCPAAGDETCPVCNGSGNRPLGMTTDEWHEAQYDNLVDERDAYEFGF